MMAREWIEIKADPQHVKRERERARLLRSSHWWQNQLAAGRCHYCAGTFAATELTMDHLIPVARGGRSIKGNVVPACAACNRSKSHLTPAEQLLNSIPTVESHPLPSGGHICFNTATALAFAVNNAGELYDWLANHDCHLHGVVVAGLLPAELQVATEVCMAAGALLIGPTGRGSEIFDCELDAGDSLATPLGTLQATEDGEIVLVTPNRVVVE